jgi:hypothetical protein
VCLITDSDVKLIRAVALAVDGPDGAIAKPATMVLDRQGTIRWLYRSTVPSDRLGQRATSEVACAVAQRKELLQKSQQSFNDLRQPESRLVDFQSAVGINGKSPIKLWSQVLLASTLNYTAI